MPVDIFMWAVQTTRSSSTRQLYRRRPRERSVTKGPVLISTGGQADQIDLGTDQTNLFFGSSSTFLKTSSTSIDRVDLTDSSIPSTAANTPHTAWSVRLLPAANINPNNHSPINGMPIAADNSVLLLNSAGEATYKPSGKFKSLRYLALDPDGVSFWVADTGYSKVYRINLDTGKRKATVSPGSGTLGGLCVLGGQYLLRLSANL
jgi:DNA-binding beta-propeller fold protein YncE